VAGVLPWYESPVGRKVTAAEDRDPDAATHERNRSEFAARIQQEPPSANRLRLIKELQSQVQATDHTATMMLIWVRAVASYVPGANPRTADIVRSPGFEKGFRDGLQAKLEEQETLSDLYAYSTLSDAELEQYVQFLSSIHGQTMTRATWSGFEHAVEAASAEVATRLAAQP
jgi:hypothetical protein